MSNNVFPTLPGQGFSFIRTPTWSTLVQQTQSGRELRIANMSYPLYKWELNFDVLRSLSPFSELQTLIGFFNARQGQYDTFLFLDPDDNFVTGQQIAIGDGVTASFPIFKNYGGYIEPVMFPTASPTPMFYLNGVLAPTAVVSSVDPAVLTFTSAPAAGVAITGTFGYYYRCRFTTDTFDFEKFMNGIWQAQKLEFISVKP